MGTKADRIAAAIAGLLTIIFAAIYILGYAGYLDSYRLHGPDRIVDTGGSE